MRNKIMHTSTMKVTADDLLSYIRLMVSLLEDQAQLLGDSDAKQAVRDIRKVRETNCIYQLSLLLIDYKMISVVYYQCGYGYMCVRALVSVSFACVCVCVYVYYKVCDCLSLC